MESTTAPSRTGVPALGLAQVVAAFEDGDDVRVVLDHLDLVVERGELVAVMGPSGSGKTTLLQIAAGHLRPSEGTVQIDGTWVTNSGPETRSRLWRTVVGVVDQRSNLLDDLSVTDNVGLPLELDGVRSADVRRAAVAALEDVGLADRAASRAGDLSTGQQQLVAVARALVGTRHLVIADEPTAALDSLAGEAVMRALRRRCDEGASALVATHDPEHAAWADRVLFLRDGRLRTATGGTAS